eukprot:PhF_6_TR33010/c0_g2_i1/m.48642/K07901/RAB8A, MEL; Ras-related protein Rab-8A
MNQHSTSDDDVIHALYKSNHPTVVPMVILSAVSSDVLRIPFDAVRNVLSMTATPLPPPVLIKCKGLQKHERTLKLLMMGDHDVGKTSFLIRFSYDEYSPEGSLATLGAEFASTTVKYQDHILKLQIWDLAGSERYRNMTRAYYTSTHGVFLCYDISCRCSFENIRRWLRELETKAEAGLPKVLVGLKADTDMRCREVSTEEGSTL